MASLRLARTFSVLKAPVNQSSLSRSNRSSFTNTTSFFHSSAIKMGVTKTTRQEGSGAKAEVSDKVFIEYTGWLKDSSKADKKGKKFDSSLDRDEDFDVYIGKGRVIRGWDEGVVQMKLGEKATLDITSDYAYGASAIGGVIPPNADLIFDVHLKKIIKPGEPGYEDKRRR